MLIHKHLVINVLCIILKYDIIIVGGAPVSTWKQSTDGMQRIRLASLKSRNDITVKKSKVTSIESHPAFAAEHEDARAVA